MNIGHTHGRLTVLAIDRSNSRRPVAVCRCDCGNQTTVQLANLPRTHSCGCLRTEQLKARSITHGLSHTAEFTAWAGMIDRCSRPSKKEFHRYGGRGITVCQRWLDSFEAFYEDMGQRPSSRHSIDRIDTNGNYEPKNCRWATAQTQRINQRRTVLYTFNGHTGTSGQLARLHGFHRKTIQKRLADGWTIDRALTVRLRKRHASSPKCT